MPFTSRLRCTEAPTRIAKTVAAATAAFALLPAIAHADTIVQGESLALNPSTGGKIVSESAANGGQALKIWSNASASKAITAADGSVNVAVRARGEQCGGAPKMTVSIDGVQRLSASVSSSSYTTYSAAVSVTPGTHTVKVAFTNDYRTSSCDRNLLVDAITLRSAPTLTGTTTTAPAPTPTTGTSGSVVFNGDFETGGLTQWSSVQRVAADRFAVQQSDVRQGQSAARVEIRGGDPLLHSGQRSEVLWGSDNNLTLKNGNEFYFGWSTKFANDFPSPTNGGHCLFIQWKNGGTGSPPLDLECKNERIQITYGGKCNGWNTPLVRGGWNDFVARIKFSPDSSVGFIELWHKAPNEAAMSKKVNHCNTATLNAGINSYLKLGYYRRNDEARTGVIFHDGMKVGTSFDAVAPR